jgi:HSP20 family protein
MLVKKNTFAKEDWPQYPCQISLIPLQPISPPFAMRRMFVVQINTRHESLVDGTLIAPPGNKKGGMTAMERESQAVPVRVYQSDEHIMLAAPMPGLEAADISIDVLKNHVTIRGEERGPGQHQRDLVVEEWTIGPYYRKISLPQDVDGSLTNATYGNGVLVLSMPKLKAGQKGSGANFQLQPIEATRGERVGHAGKEIHPKSSLERDKQHG